MKFPNDGSFMERYRQLMAERAAAEATAARMAGKVDGQVARDASAQVDDRMTSYVEGHVVEDGCATDILPPRPYTSEELLTLGALVAASGITPSDPIPFYLHRSYR